MKWSIYLSVRHHLSVNPPILKVGCQPRIPRDETLLYELHVVNFVDFAAAADFDDRDERGQVAATFQEKLEAARAFHRRVRIFWELPVADVFVSDDWGECRHQCCLHWFYNLLS